MEDEVEEFYAEMEASVANLTIPELQAEIAAAQACLDDMEAKTIHVERMMQAIMDMIRDNSESKQAEKK